MRSRLSQEFCMRQVFWRSEPSRRGMTVNFTPSASNSSTSARISGKGLSHPYADLTLRDPPLPRSLGLALRDAPHHHLGGLSLTIEVVSPVCNRTDRPVRRADW